jgi:hypothetical protein
MSLQSHVVFLIIGEDPALFKKQENFKSSNQFRKKVKMGKIFYF